MSKIIVTGFLGLAALYLISCASHQAQQAAIPDYTNFVYIAGIDPKAAHHVSEVLLHAGIQPIVEGSIAYDVLVPKGTESRAVSLLRADSASQKYYIQFSEAWSNKSLQPTATAPSVSTNK